jgi:uncharacterized protein YerC
VIRLLEAATVFGPASCCVSHRVMCPTALVNANSAAEWMQSVTADRSVRHVHRDQYRVHIIAVDCGISKHALVLMTQCMPFGHDQYDASMFKKRSVW